MGLRGLLDWIGYPVGEGEEGEPPAPPPVIKIIVLGGIRFVENWLALRRQEEEQMAQAQIYEEEDEEIALILAL